LLESGAESAGERIAVVAREHKRSGRYTYLADLPKPVKMGLPDYNLLETQVETVIAEKFGLALPAPPEVKSADLAMLKHEGRPQETEIYVRYAKVLPPPHAAGATG
jgi:hypothetical protein